MLVVRFKNRAYLLRPPLDEPPPEELRPPPPDEPPPKEPPPEELRPPPLLEGENPPLLRPPLLLSIEGRLREGSWTEGLASLLRFLPLLGLTDDGLLLPLFVSTFELEVVLPHSS